MLPDRLPARLTNMSQPVLLKHFSAIPLTCSKCPTQDGMIKVADLNGQTWDQSPPRDSSRSKWVELGLKSTAQKWTQGREFWKGWSRPWRPLEGTGWDRRLESGVDCGRLRWICIGWAGFEVHSPGWGLRVLNYASASALWSFVLLHSTLSKPTSQQCVLPLQTVLNFVEMMHHNNHY